MTTTTLKNAPNSQEQAATFLSQAYLQGRFLPFKDANISIATHALHYGTGVLGGIRALPNPSVPNQILIFRLDAHCQRLCNSAKYLGYAIDPADLKTTLIEFVCRNRPTEPFYIRPLIYTAGLGVAPRLHDIEKDLIIYGIPMGDYLKKKTVRCRISSWSRQRDLSQPLRAKTTAAYIASALAKTEAIESGFDEAILLNSHGKISEASAMNLFIVRQGQLITPSIEQDILEGITRDSLLTVARDLGIPTVERPVDKSELMIADEIFLCGTAAQIVPVASVENYTLPEQRPVTQQLQQCLREIMQGKNSSYTSWLTQIDYGQVHSV
ncbi:branched-chain amino acid transaminase [Leptolyngbya cf. ectocarpi LEGE 11479]|uniref:Branched-chain-amino-acid aminotransferase n=1 Tax=Leptolyngbya cf. ectocarpi LEGE 11479 TaxID=1828722 RepID=A0A928ZZF5_LEPEC|nr:branched-chain amino acid transaminase [Leptolyngbya ectocarpi]MBE9070256.1 branched-chain amino acid transaminase [Leptolyngbya cf. ectocarpi LEGE 11479]